MAAADAMHLVNDGEPDWDAKLVALTSRDIDDARRLLGLLARVDEQDASAVAANGAPPHEAKSQKELVRIAWQMLTARRRRLERFGRAMFGEPAWEMLLLLYVTQDAQRHTVSRLAALSGGTRSTATRWIEYLERQQLIQRESHPTDKRMAFVELTDKGRDSLSAYLSETLPMGG